MRNRLKASCRPYWPKRPIQFGRYGLPLFRLDVVGDAADDGAGAGEAMGVGVIAGVREDVTGSETNPVGITTAEPWVQDARSRTTWRPTQNMSS